MNKLILKTTVTDLLAQKEQIINDVVEGNINPLDVACYFKEIENVINSVRKDDRIKPLILEEAKKFKGQEYHGHKIEVREKKNYDFKQDAKWAELNKALKAREKLLKAANGDVVDPETGEILTAPISSTTEYAVIN